MGVSRSDELEAVVEVDVPNNRLRYLWGKWEILLLKIYKDFAEI